MDATRTLQVGGKTVIAALPFRVPQDAFCGRTDELRTLAAACMASVGEHRLPLAPLLVGAPGGGKNRLVYELARLSRRELWIIQGHEDLTPEDLVCTARFGDGPSAPVEYVASGLTTAMLRGGICMIDELGKIRPRALAPLASVLDERRYLDSTLLGERIQAQPGFRLVAATNAGDFDTALPDFIASRLRPMITIENPSHADLECIVAARFTHLDGRREGLFRELWQLDERRRRRSSAAPPLTPRDVIFLFSLAQSIADSMVQNGEPSSSPQGLALEGPEPPAAIENRHLQMAFEELCDGS